MGIILVLLTGSLLGQSFEHGEIGINGFGAVERRGTVNRILMGVGSSYQVHAHLVPFLEFGTSASANRRLISQPEWQQWNGFAGVRIPFTSKSRVEPYLGVGAAVEAGRCAELHPCRQYETGAAALAGARFYLMQGFGLQPEVRVTRLLNDKTLAWRLGVSAFYTLGKPYGATNTSRRRRAIILTAMLGMGGAALALGATNHDSDGRSGGSTARIAIGGSSLGPPQ